MQLIFVLVEVTFCASIGLIGADGVTLKTLFMNLLVVSDTNIYEGVGNCLVVKNGGGYHVFLVHVVCFDETGWNRRHLEAQT